MASVLSVEELQAIVATICNPTTDQVTRTSAERRLQELQNEEGSWRAHIQLLSSVEGTLLFFLCLGLQRIIWKQWNGMNVNDHEVISNTIVSQLASKSHALPQFARTKLELVLAAICINSYSFAPVLQLLEANDDAIVVCGISALKTVLEEIYQIDNRINPASRDVLIKSANEIIGPATQLACRVCQSCIQSQTPSLPSLISAIALLKVIVGKADIGPHITPDVLNLLFVIAQLGASDSETSPVSFSEASIKAVGVLTDLMGRRYLPRAPTPSPSIASPSPLSPGSLFRAGPGAGPLGSRSPGLQSVAPRDVAADILVDLVVKAINLLQTYRQVGDVDESPVVLPLLEFITTFAEYQLERCLMSPSSGMAANISAFLREIASLSSASTEPKYLAKIAAVWENLLNLESVLDHMVAELGDSVCVVVSGHLLLASLATMNPNLKEVQEDLEDDVIIENFADPHIRELVGHLGTSSVGSSDSTGGNSLLTSRETESGVDSIAGQPENAEEFSCEGSTLRMLTASVLQMLGRSPEVRGFLTTKLGELLQTMLQMLSNAGDTNARSAAMDICFLVPLMPIVSPADVLVPSFSGLMVQLVNARIYSQGKPFVNVIVTLANTITKLVPSLRGTSDAGSAMLATTLQPMLQATLSACDTTIAPAPFPIMTSLTSMLLMSVFALSASFDKGQFTDTQSLLAQSLRSSLLPRLGLLPLEVQALVVCTAQTLMPDVAGQLSQQLHALSGTICSDSTKSQPINPGTLSALNRLCGSLDALARHQSVLLSKRQSFIASIGALQECLPPLLSHFLGAIEVHAMSGNAVASSSGVMAFLLSTQMILSLITGLLTSLGKRSFGSVGVMTLSCCSSFIQFSQSREILCSSYSGLSLLKVILQLLIEVATTSSALSTNSSYQIEITTVILSFVVNHFQDQRICAELLQQTLKAGTVTIACYWQNKNVISSSSSNSNSNGSIRIGNSSAVILNSSASSGSEGESCSVLPIAKILVQLFIGSMDPNVPPHDAQDAVDGIKFLVSEHNLFSVQWFQEGGCWEGIASAVIRALLLQSHPTLQEGLCNIFDALIKSELKYGSSHSFPPSLSQGTWSYIGNEVYRHASEIGCGDRAGQYLNGIIAKYADTSRIDSAVFMQEVVQPLAVAISKSKDS